jgi:hypothetical protein
MAIKRGMLYLDARIAKKGTTVCSPFPDMKASCLRGEGQGYSVVIFWSDDKNPQSMDPVILLHELVHAAQVIRGQSHRGQYVDKTDYEEVLANLIENIFRSERNRNETLYYYGTVRTFWGYPRAIDPKTYLTDEIRQMIVNLSGEQGVLFAQLANIPESICVFNPIRDVSKALRSRPAPGTIRQP